MDYHYWLTDRKLIAEKTTELTLSPVGPHLEFKPGQHFELSLIDNHGTPNRDDRRSFSFASAPRKNGLLKLAFRHSPSEFKRRLLTQPLNTPLLVEGPFGEFSWPTNQPAASVGLIAGGIGITPFRALLENHLTLKTGSVKQTSLLYANSSPTTAAYLSELYSWSQGNRFYLLDHYGPINKIILTLLIAKNRPDVFLIAGPVTMVNITMQLLQMKGIKRSQITIEQFTGY